MIISAFTEKYDSIRNKLINSAVVEYENEVVPVKTQWDTGATGTCISTELAIRMNLAPIGMQKVQTPSGSAILNTYIIDLVLNDEVVIKNLNVMDSEIGKQGIDVLIGMDVISIGDFAVSNYQGKTQFSFRIPSQTHIEYKKE